MLVGGFRHWVDCLKWVNTFNQLEVYYYDESSGLIVFVGG
jgi:hypothetical protein